jgi:hypothetical protein
MRQISFMGAVVAVSRGSVLQVPTEGDSLLPRQPEGAFFRSAANPCSRGDRTTFPDAFTVSGGGITNEHRFQRVLLWEHADRIRSGELAELAPLLVLCEDTPTEATLRDERRLILGLDVPAPVRADLLAVAVTVGARYFARELLLNLFREELQMLKEASIVEERVQEGMEQGRLQEARQTLLDLLRQRFGDIPSAVAAVIEQADLEQCRNWVRRVGGAASLAELGLDRSPEDPAAARDRAIQAQE